MWVAARHSSSDAWRYPSYIKPVLGREAALLNGCRGAIPVHLPMRLFSRFDRLKTASWMQATLLHQSPIATGASENGP
jgi:hypothetical protein